IMMRFLPPAAGDMRFLTPTRPVLCFWWKSSASMYQLPTDTFCTGRTFSIAAQDLFGALEQSPCYWHTLTLRELQEQGAAIAFLVPYLGCPAVGTYWFWALRVGPSVSRNSGIWPEAPRLKIAPEILPAHPSFRVEAPGRGNDLLLMEKFIIPRMVTIWSPDHVVCRILMR